VKKQFIHEILEKTSNYGYGLNVNIPRLEMLARREKDPRSSKLRFLNCERKN
jgi:hypothetical protein